MLSAATAEESLVPVPSNCVHYGLAPNLWDHLWGDQVAITIVFVHPRPRRAPAWLCFLSFIMPSRLGIILDNHVFCIYY